MEKRIKKPAVASPEPPENFIKKTQVFLFSAGVVRFDEPPQEIFEERKPKDRLRNQ